MAAMELQVGMYDWINYETTCPICGNKVDGFQSKDNICELETLEPWEVDNFYTHCEPCNHSKNGFQWIEFERIPYLDLEKAMIKNIKKSGVTYKIPHRFKRTVKDHPEYDMVIEL